MNVLREIHSIALRSGLAKYRRGREDSTRGGHGERKKMPGTKKVGHCDMKSRSGKKNSHAQLTNDVHESHIPRIGLVVRTPIFQMMPPTSEKLMKWDALKTSAFLPK
jgi:hypothetical protein